MGLFVEFDVVDDFGYIDATEEFNIYPDYDLGCQIFAETFNQVARELVPVDTGYLRSTIVAEGGDTYCYAETDCDYAQYPEYGTWCQGAQPYFTPALQAAIMAAAPYWNQAQEEAMLEEELLIEEERLARQAEAFARQQRGEGYASYQRGLYSNWAASGRHSHPGMLNFSSVGAFFGSLLGMFIAAVIVATVREIINIDNNYTPRYGRSGSDANRGELYIPEVIIT